MSTSCLTEKHLSEIHVSPASVLICCAFVFGLQLISTQTQAQDLRNEGYVLARQWCQSCHVVDAGRSASSQAPAFVEIAGNPKITDSHLRVWLSTPHAQMPDLNLSRNEITALISYLDSLRPG
ncbi:cytochrome c [Pelagibius sp. Alg239-R121]|uniref:c-type cytochrome n=1 Tax=Pelagibius sp. Alg239-R121 TaxID=2993448 RepID=UPI0024A65FA0|nr:cytochrome c [Pelagibius sp. Alg239-R121]